MDQPKFPNLYAAEPAQPVGGNLLTVVGFSIGAGMMIAAAAVAYWYMEKKRR